MGKAVFHVPGKSLDQAKEKVEQAISSKWSKRNSDYHAGDYYRGTDEKAYLVLQRNWDSIDQRELYATGKGVEYILIVEAEDTRPYHDKLAVSSIHPIE